MSELRLKEKTTKDTNMKKPPIAPKPKLKRSFADAYLLTKKLEDSLDMSAEQSYPCICEHLASSIETTVPSPRLCRELFDRKTPEIVGVHNRSGDFLSYLKSNRDSGNSSVSSCSSSCGTTSRNSAEDEYSSGESSMHDVPKGSEKVQRPITDDRNRNKTGDKQQYASLDNSREKPRLNVNLSHPEAKESAQSTVKYLSRYFSQDDPKDRPSLPPKPLRITSKKSRPNSNEGLSDQETDYNENLDLVDHFQAVAESSGQIIDTVRDGVLPVRNVLAKGPLTENSFHFRQSVAIDDMDSGPEFTPVVVTQTSIDLEGSSKSQTPVSADTPSEHKKANKSNRQKGKGNDQQTKSDIVVESSKSGESKGLIKRVKSIKMQNPFKKNETEDEQDGETSEKKSGIIGKMFNRKNSQNIDIEEYEKQKEKKTIGDRFNKVLKRDKKGKFEDIDLKDDPKEIEPSEIDDGEGKKKTVFGKMFSREGQTAKDAELDNELETKTTSSFMKKMFQKDAKDPLDDDETEEKKSSFVTRVFSRDAREDDIEIEGQDKKKLSERISDFKGKLFSRKDSVSHDVEINNERNEKSFLDRYLPPEPIIQQYVLTEEMEPDLKKRRMGKIISFQQTKEVEGEIESPAKKMLKQNLEKISNKVKEVQEIMPKTFSAKKERPPGVDEVLQEEKHDYEVTTQVTVKTEAAPVTKGAVINVVSSNLSDREDLQITPTLAEGSDSNPVDKTTVFYAKVGDSEIEVKEDHFGRIQMGARRDPIYARPFKFLKQSLSELSKSSPSLPTEYEQPVEYVDVTEQDMKEETVSHHYEPVGEPGKRKKLISTHKIRGCHGSPKVIKVETELVKGKSTSALNEPATISTVRTVEMQKPPVPPRPRTTTPTIIGKPSSNPTTPTSSLFDDLTKAPFADEEDSTRATSPASSVGDSYRKKVAPPRPPPPKITTTNTVSIETIRSKRPPKPFRPPPPKVTVIKTVEKSAVVSPDRYSVSCQTDVGLSTDLLAKIERVVSSTPGSFDAGPFKPPRSRSTSKTVDSIVEHATSCHRAIKSYEATIPDDGVRFRKVAHESDLSKRISTLQIVEEEELPLAPPRLRRTKSESDLESSDSIYYDCLAPECFRIVSWANEDEVRVYDRATDESCSNSLSQNTPPPSAAPSQTDLNDTSTSNVPKISLPRDPSLDSDSDWSDQPVKLSPSLLLKKKIAQSHRDTRDSSTDTDTAVSPKVVQPRKRVFKRSPVHSTVESKVPDGFKRYQPSDSGEDTDDLLKRAQEVQEQLRKLLSYRTEQLRVCLEADMSSSTDADVETPSKMENSAIDESLWSDSEEEKDVTPPPTDPQEKALKHAANVAGEIASSEAVFVDVLKLIVEDFKGAINRCREERGDILIPNEVLNPILLYLPELLQFSSDLLENLNERVSSYETNKVIADVFVKNGHFLKLYTHYIKDYQARCDYLEDARRRYPEFNQVVRDFEASDRCNKLTVVQYMLKPVQRIPQYRLMLNDYFKHLSEDHPDRANTEKALQIVSGVADHANEAIKEGDIHAEMVRLQNSLITTRFNVFNPGRILIKQGNLLKHNRKTPQLKRVVLFTDCLVYMTQVQSNLNTFKLNRQLPLNGLTVEIDEKFDNEFHILSTTKSFTLVAQNQEELQEWTDAIRQAVNDFERKRRTFQVKEESDELKGEIDRAPVWTPDSRVTMCQLCQVSFTTFRRRHHCRACGRVVCGVCSKNEAWFQYNGGGYERVCDNCAVKLPRDRLKSTASLPAETPSPESTKNNILFELRSDNDDSTMSGYLKMFKRGSWKRYWYVLRKQVLYVYKASADVAPMHQMVVLGYEVVDETKKPDQLDLCFTLRHKGLEDLVLCAEDPDTAAKWKESIRDASQL